MDNEFKSWFGGFCDGEATFHIERNGQPRFQIALRSDDAEVLQVICREIEAGVVRTYCNDRYDYSVYIIAGNACSTLLPVLDGQLRSKKQRDYECWATAIRERDSLPSGSRLRKPLMLSYKKALEEARRKDVVL